MLINAKVESAIVNYFSNWDIANPGVARPVVRLHHDGRVYINNDFDRLMNADELQAEASGLIYDALYREGLRVLATTAVESTIHLNS